MPKRTLCNAPPGDPALPELVTQMSGVCSGDNEHCWRQRSTLVGFASQCGAEGHASFGGDDEWRLAV